MISAFEANQIPLVAFLATLGHHPHHRSRDRLWYLSPLRHETTPSFSVTLSRNLWVDFGSGHGGRLIDLALHLWKIPLSDVLKMLDDTAFTTPSHHLHHRATSTRSSHPIVESTGPVRHPALRRYLRSRAIPQSLAQRYLLEIHYRIPPKAFFALALPNQSGGFEIRNPFFKGTLFKKDISHFPRHSAQALVFEGAFDFLAYLILSKITHLHDHVIILNSTALASRAAALLDTLPIKRLFLSLDNDTAGRLATQALVSLSPCPCIDLAPRHFPHKDWADFLLARHQTHRG